MKWKDLQDILWNKKEMVEKLVWHDPFVWGNNDNTEFFLSVLLIFVCITSSLFLSLLTGCISFSSKQDVWPSNLTNFTTYISSHRERSTRYLDPESKTIGQNSQWEPINYGLRKWQLLGGGANFIQGVGGRAILRRKERRWVLDRKGGKYGAPGWLSRLSGQLRLRWWSHSKWV